MLGLLLACLQGAAQTAAPRVTFDIAGGPLAEVLLQIGRAAGVLVSFSPDLVRQAQAPAVRGSYTVLEAVTLASRPSGLAVDVTTNGAVTLSAAPPAPVVAARPAAAGGTPGAAVPEAVAVLPRVEVLGTGRRQEDGLKALRGSSATRTDILLADLPQSVSVLTSEALDLQGGSTSTEAVRYVSGVASRMDINGGQAMVPSLTVRGLPALYALSGMGTARATLPVDNAFIDRIEVPKGPSSVISGLNSYGGRGGVVNLVRKEAGVQPQRRLVQGGSSQDGGTARFEADLADRAGQDLSWRMVAYGAATGPTDGGYDRRGGAGALLSSRYEGRDFTATMTTQLDRRRLTPPPVSLGGLPQPDGTASPITPGLAAPADPADRLLVGVADTDVTLEWRFRPRWRAMLKTRFEAVDNDQRHVQLIPVQRRSTLWNAALQGGLGWDVDTGPVRHQLLAGLDLTNWRMRLVDAALVPGGNPGLGRVDVRDAKRELLLQDQWRYGPLRGRLAVQAARVPIYEGGVPREDERALNRDVGLLLRLTQEASVYAGSQYAIETDIIRAIGPVLFSGSGEPTRTRQAQAGLKLDLLDDRLALTLEAFRMEQFNVPSVRTPDEDNAFFLTPRRRVLGLDLDLSGRLSAAWELQFGLNVMRATDLTDAALPLEVAAAGIPRRSMHLLSRVHLPARWGPQTSLGLALRARSSSFGLTPDPARPGLQFTLPGSAELNLSLERRVGPWSLNLLVRNVLDRDIYEIQGVPGTVPLEPGRSVGLTATWQGRGVQP